MDDLNEKSIWDKEQEFLLAERNKNPELFQKPLEASNNIDFLKYLGVELKENNIIGKGCLKYLPYDFIVEEIKTDDSIVSVEKGNENIKIEPGKSAMFVEMTKIGISTLDAINNIAIALNIPKKNISYAGIKDAGALTAQHISIRNIKNEQVENLDLPDIILRNPQEGKGVLSVGELSGNRFTILIRTAHPVDEKEISTRFEKINKEGFYNFFGSQRFGSPRFLSHEFGKYLCQGNLDELLRVYLCGKSQFEWPYVLNIRDEAFEKYGNWAEMEKIMSILPYTFRCELMILNKLKEDDSSLGVIKAISVIPEQVKLWVYAYASYLANILLSAISKESTPPPEKIPLVISRNREVQNIYQSILDRDKTRDFFRKLRAFPFIYINEISEIPTKIYPKINHFAVVPEGVIVNFDLSKGAYASTFLNYFFEMTEYESVITSEDKAKFIDLKKVLGTGSIEDLYKKFGKREPTLTTKK